MLQEFLLVDWCFEVFVKGTRVPSITIFVNNNFMATNIYSVRATLMVTIIVSNKNLVPAGHTYSNTRC